MEEDEQFVEQQTAPSVYFMQRLSEWEAALDSPAKLAVLREQTRRTPTLVEGPLSAAVALVDAVDLRCPGTDDGTAIKLCEEIFEMQARDGFLWPDGRIAAGIAAIFYVAHTRRIESLLNSAGGWWRQLIDLMGDEKNGVPPRSVQAIYGFVQRGERATAADPGMIAPRIFYRLENVPLPKPATPYPLAVRGEALEEDHRFDGHVAVVYAQPPQPVPPPLEPKTLQMIADRLPTARVGLKTLAPRGGGQMAQLLRELIDGIAADLKTAGVEVAGGEE